MPEFYLTEENLEFFNRENYKSRNKKCKKITTSHTCTKASRKCLNRYNKDAVLTEKYSNLPKNVEKIFVEKNLLQTYSYKNTTSEGTMIRNRSSQNVTYSMNKKNRWILPDIIRSYAEEIYPFKPTNKDSESKKENDNESIDFGITAYFLDKKTSRRNKLESFEYYDNNQTHLAKSFNYNSLYTQINNIPRRNFNRSDERRNSRQIRGERVFYRKEKPHSQNKSRKNPNSWFNEPLTPRENDGNEMTERFRDANKIQFNFLLPRKILSHSKCCEIGSRYGMLSYEKKFKYNWGHLREFRRENRDKKSFSIADTKKEPTESFSSLDNRDMFIYDSSPIFTTIEEVLLFSKKESFPSASIFASKKNSNYSSFELKPREIIQIDENDAVCFHSGSKKVITSKIEENEIIPQNNAVHIKPNGIFKKYQLQVNDKDEFLRSLNDDSQITFDITPAQLILNLENIHSYLIINLSTLDSFYLNTNLNDYAEMDKLCKKSQEKDFCSPDDLTRFLNQNIRREEILTTIKNKKLKLTNLIGKYSFIDEETLIKSYSLQLNPVFNEKKYVFKHLASSRSTERKLCQVCFDESDETNFLKLNNCEHEACIDCWREWMIQKIENMKVTVSFNKEKSHIAHKICCLFDKCETTLRLDTIICLLPIDFANKFVRFYSDLQIMQLNSNLIYCKDKKCNKLIKISKDDNEMVSTCECGQMICNFCFKENHFPSMCIQAREYFKSIEELNEIMIQDATELATSEGKKCPACENYMEKNMGCNHMSCPCGFQFCWLCLKDFYQNHQASTGYACNNKPVETLKYDASYFVSIKSIRLKFAAVMRESRQRKTSVKLQQKTNNNFKNLAIFSKSQLSKEIKNIFSCPSSNHKERVNDLLKSIGLKLKFEEFNQDLMNSSLDIDLDEVIENVKSNFFNFNLVIEYLALLLSRRSKKLVVSNYSFGTNLYRSLKKAMLVYSLQNENIDEYEKGLEQLRRILFYDKIIRDFVLNLKHLTLNFLKIYDSPSLDKVKN